jgi:hypothetical protein
MRTVSRFALLIILASVAVARAANAQPLARELEPLSIAAGTWLYHGVNMPTADQKAGNWTWLENCGWSPNRAFMACSFTMNGIDGLQKSLAISTYNDRDKSYWHYEVFTDDGDSPFIARMTVSGDTWTYDGKSGKTNWRVTYHYKSATELTLRVEQSTDHVHWATVAHAEARKQR